MIHMLKTQSTIYSKKKNSTTNALKKIDMLEFIFGFIHGGNLDLIWKIDPKIPLIIIRTKKKNKIEYHAITVAQLDQIIFFPQR